MKMASDQMTFMKNLCPLLSMKRAWSIMAPSWNADLLCYGSRILDQIGLIEHNFPTVIY